MLRRARSSKLAKLMFPLGGMDVKVAKVIFRRIQKLTVVSKLEQRFENYH
jgi:hypothetical protein